MVSCAPQSSDFSSGWQGSMFSEHQAKRWHFFPGSFDPEGLTSGSRKRAMENGGGTLLGGKLGSPWLQLGFGAVVSSTCYLRSCKVFLLSISFKTPRRGPSLTIHFSFCSWIRMFSFLWVLREVSFGSFDLYFSFEQLWLRRFCVRWTTVPVLPEIMSYGYIGAPANFNGTMPEGGDSS